MKSTALKSNAYHRNKLDKMRLLLQRALADLARAGVLMEACEQGERIYGWQASVCAIGDEEYGYC